MIRTFVYISSALLWMNSICTIASAITLYQVGNSFTQDSAPFAISSIATYNDLSLTNGWHIKCDSSLYNIANNPDANTCVVPNAFGKYSVALPGNKWDAVALQSYRHGDTNFAKEAAAGRSLIDLTLTNPTNANTTFYLYEVWPPNLGDTSFDNWEQPNPVGEVLYRRDYFETLADAWQGDSNIDVRILPAGEALFRLQRDILAGAFPWATSVGDLYRDNQHLSAIGGMIAGLTVTATTLGVDPRTLEIPNNYWGSNSLPNAEVARIKEIVYEAMLFTPRAGYVTPGDFNDDGQIDTADYAVWRDLKGSETAYRAWRTAYQPTSGSSSVATPEPTAITLGLLGMLLVFRHDAKFAT